MHERFPLHWKIVKGQFDMALCWYYEEMAETDTKIIRFVARMRNELALFADEVGIDDLIAANGAYTSIPHGVARVMSACETGRTMLASVWLSCSREIFLKKALDALADLEKEDFMDDRDTAFKQLMEQESRKLRVEGHRRGKQKWNGKVMMHGAVVGKTFDFAADEWEMMYWGRVKAIIENRHQIEPMPGEKLLIPKGSVAQCPAHLKFPEGVTKGLASLHEAVMDMLDGRLLNMADMINVMKKHAVELTDAHRSFLLDLEFLDTKAQDMLRAKAY